MASKKIKCPLLGTEIEDGICFDIHMNVEGLAPVSNTHLRAHETRHDIV